MTRGRGLDRLGLFGEAELDRREFAIATALLGLVGIVVYGTHVAHGGLYGDDWSLEALYRFPTAAGHVHDFLNQDASRPVQELWLLMIHAVLGLHPGPQLGLALLLALLASTLFYVLLRRLGLRRGEAWAIAAMSLLFPSSDADKMWFTQGVALVSIIFCCSGLLLMLDAFKREGRRAVITHAMSLGFYALSIMTYEFALPLIAVSACLFAWRRAPRRDVLQRTGADVVVTLLVVALVTSQTRKSPSFALSALWAHAKAIINQGSLIFGESLFPFYSVPEHRLIVSVIALIVIAGVAVRKMLPADDRDRRLLDHGLMLIAAGVLVALLCWVVLLPANIVYSPNAGGDGTRVNAAATFGIVTAVFGLLLVVCVLVFRGFSNSCRTASIAAFVAAGLVSIGYARLVVQDVHKWDHTNSVRNHVLASIQRSVPHPKPGTFILTTGFPQEPYANIGTFDFPWDLNAATQLLYDNPTITGQAIVTDADLHSGPTELTPLIAIGQVPDPPVPYGPSVYLVNTATNSVWVIRLQSVCLALGGTRA